VMYCLITSPRMVCCLGEISDMSANDFEFSTRKLPVLTQRPK
jgi:hypothetical protein